VRPQIEALRQLAKLAVETSAGNETLVCAASAIREATGAGEVLLVYAEDQDLLVCGGRENGASADFTQIGLWLLQRRIIESGGPVAFNLVGHRVESFTSPLSSDRREFLGFSVPTTESPSEMCILRGTWEQTPRPRILRFMESATPALTVILERFLNAGRGRRLAQQLQTLANAAQVLTGSEDVEAALRDLATAISAASGFEYIVNIDLYDALTGRFVLRILSDHRHTAKTLGQVWGASLRPEQPDPWNKEVMHTLQPRFSPDMQSDPLYPEHVRKFYARALLRSAVDFPLLFQDEFLGTMSFVSFKPSMFPPEEVGLLQGFVSQTAMALKALQMHKELHRYAFALKRSADEYIATTNLTSDIIAKLDARGRWVFLNDATCQFLGEPREALLGADSATWVHPDDRGLTAQRVRDTRAKRGLTTGLVNRMITPAGTRVVEWDGYPLFDNEGLYIGIQMTGRDITERREMEEERERLYAELEGRAITDGLTGLYNHAHFYQRLSQEIDRSKRYRRRFAVVMMDVDNFKCFNDSCGHQAGDDVLRRVADGIRSAMRRSDLAFRYGGDEFAAILLHADSAKAQTVTQRINMRITKVVKQMTGCLTGDLGLSAGVACFPGDATTVDELVRMADAALYDAKRLLRARAVEALALAGAPSAS
jgi:diguanylate cyclase (GGDEF)-like protein/PAS domain S-box-containing protein